MSISNGNMDDNDSKTEGEVSSPNSVNIKMSKAPNESNKGRGFAFTDNTYKEGDFSRWEEFIRKFNPSHFICGEEHAGTTGKLHLQGGFYFTNGRSLRGLKRELAGVHLEVCYKSYIATIRYCKKDDKFFEYGDAPAQGKRSDLDEIKDVIDRGGTEQELARDFFPIWIRYHKAFKRYGELKREPRREKTRVTCIWGPSGTGKSKYCFERGAVFVGVSGDPRRPFIQGYKGEPVVCFDDFSQSSISLTEILKLTDRYPYTANSKGGEVEWNPTEAYFTSNDNPWYWYGGAQSWRRRIDSVICLDKVSVEPSEEKKEAGTIVPSVILKVDGTNGNKSNMLREEIRATRSF